MLSPRPPLIHGGLRRQPLANWLFADSPGLQISGDSGCGKSNVLEVLAETLLEQGQPLMFIDPHGDSAKKLERFALTLPERLRRRVLVIRPADTEKIIGINPLAVARHGPSEFDGRAMLTSKIGHVSRILLAAWGETDFNSRPRMFTWTTRILKTLATCGLTIPDAKYFLDVGGPVYQALVRAVPDLMQRHAFEDLADRRPRDVDEQIESTRSRMLGFLENPIIETMLGRTEEVLDFQQAIDEGLSVIVDLEPCGKLREEDQTILANLLLTEFLYAVMNLPLERRRLYFCFIDELPIFAESSGPLLERALCQVRKFLVRFVLAHQGTQRFPEGVADPLLNTIVAQCAVHLVMRHANPIDAKYFGELIALPHFHPRKIKHRLSQPVQWQAGHDLVVLQDRSSTTGASDQVGGGESAGSTDTSSWNRDESANNSATRGTQRDEEHLHKVVSEAHSQGRSERQGEGGSSATSRQQNSSWSRTQNHSTSRTHRQTLVPKHTVKQIITSIQFYTPEEQVLMPASRIAGLPLGAALLHVSGTGAAEVQFPRAKDTLAKTPAFAARKLAAFRRWLFQRIEYRAPADVLAAREALLLRLLAALETRVEVTPDAPPSLRMCGPRSTEERAPWNI